MKQIYNYCIGVLFVFSSTCVTVFSQNDQITQTLISESNCPTTQAIYKTDSIARSEAEIQICRELEKMHKRMRTIHPDYLKVGDSVGIMTVSSPVSQSREKADSLIDIVRSWGLKVRLGENLFKHEDGAFSVSDMERGEELQRMIDNDNLKAIIFYRGGYGAIRTLDYVDFSRLKKHPKWMLGFSDLTTYLSIFCNMNLESIHCAMLNSFSLSNPVMDIDTRTTRAALFGEIQRYDVEPNEYNQSGEVEGVIVGGNMSLMAVSHGTPYDLKIGENNILYIEEVDENMNTIDRFMQQLKKSGKLSKVKGMIIGNFVRAKDTGGWDVSIYDLIKTYTQELDIPVLYGLRSGHGKINHALYFGQPVKMIVSPEGSSIIFE